MIFLTLTYSFIIIN